MYSLRMSFWMVPESLRGSGAGAFGDGYVEREQDAGGGVDGHGGGDLVEGDTFEEAGHVFDGIDRNADFADFAEGEGGVGVVADLGGEVRRLRTGRRCRGEEEFVAAVGFFGVAPCRRIGAWSTDGRDTWWAGCRGCKGIGRGVRGRTARRGVVDDVYGDAGGCGGRAYGGLGRFGHARVKSNSAEWRLGAACAAGAL